MKRLIMLLGISMAVIFTVVGVVQEQRRDATGDISGGLYVLANRSDMAKSAMVGKKITFSANDFEKSLNLAKITSITVTSVPEITDGCLCLGEVLVNKGQTISRENLALLNYRVGDERVKESFFTFKVNESEYEMRCNLYFLDRANQAPTLELEDERAFSVSTHQTVRVWGKVGAYDPDGDKMRYEVVKYARGGVIELDSETGEYTYTPSGAYFGEDSFEYVAVDKYGNYSTSKEVALNVEKLKTDAIYTDMQDHKDHHAALTMTEKGIMNGTTIGNNTFFMPDKSVSRVDFVVMLMHAIGVDEVEAVADTGFDDDAEIPKSMKGYVYKARDMGLINGAVDADGNYLFEPNRAISRAEAALIVNKVVKGSVPTVKPTFADKNEIPAWAQDAIYSLNDIGILVSINGEFAPSADLTRAQTAQTLYALMEYLD